MRQINNKAYEMHTKTVKSSANSLDILTEHNDDHLDNDALHLAFYIWMRAINFHRLAKKKKINVSYKLKIYSTIEHHEAVENISNESSHS